MHEQSAFEGSLPAWKMTRREMIAMHVLAGLCAEAGEGVEYSAMAGCAVSQADALLVALHDEPETKGDDDVERQFRDIERKTKARKERDES